MPDITQLILNDHERFRRGFVAIDDLAGRSPVNPDELESAWAPLATRMDVHAIAEEEIFYPELLRVGSDAEDETLDAIGDHNDIRDGLHDAARHPVGSTPWLEAVARARRANDAHMAEEEREGIADFRRHASEDLRAQLGERFEAFMNEHESVSDLDTNDKDPEGYVHTVEAELGTSGQGDRPDRSLGIGSLKGQPSH